MSWVVKCFITLQHNFQIIYLHHIKHKMALTSLIQYYGVIRTDIQSNSFLILIERAVQFKGENKEIITAQACLISENCLINYVRYMLIAQPNLTRTISRMGKMPFVKQYKVCYKNKMKYKNILIQIFRTIRNS